MKTGQVFVSHTSDMARFPAGRSFIDAVLDAVNRVGMVPVDMRHFPAREGAPAGYCRARVRECDVYVAVVGFRYGSIVPGEKISYTELEFAEATEAKLPRLVFLLDEEAGLPGTPRDAEPGTVEGFRRRLRGAGLVVRSFTSADRLELEVFHALTDLASTRVAGARFWLPPDTATFTGRVPELEVITSAVTEDAGAGGVVGIHAIGGMPGVGKTALAVHAAHRLKDRFPDRQLFIDLHGHTPGQDPVPAKAALAGLLAAAGVDARAMPADLAGRAGLWREVMAGQRALLVLDNAASSAQVTPLLPGAAKCLVLVTSRRHLGDLPGPVTPVPVDVLTLDQGREMFTLLAPHAATAPAAAVEEVVRLAGRLPLAICLLARVYARHPAWTLADLAAETEAGVLILTAENDSVATAFEVSYRHLDPARQQFFRRLGLHLGTTTDEYAAAALAGVPLAETAGLLDGLHGEGLLTEVSRRRYGMHDLIRHYARDLAAADPEVGRSRAVSRLLDYYQHAAATAQALLARQARTSPPARAGIAVPTAVPCLADRERALRWSRAERVNLLACLDHATGSDQHARVIALTAGLAGLLRQDGPWADAIARHEAAAQAARHLGDQHGAAGALTDLGDVRQLTGDYPGAVRAAEEALVIFRDLGDRLGQGNAMTEIGIVRQLTGDYPGAAEALEKSLGIYRALGDQLGQASALRQLGVVRWLAGDYPGTAETAEKALGISRDLGDRLGQASALRQLGAVRLRTGDYPGAAKALGKALGIFLNLGHRVGHACTLGQLGAVRLRTGDYPGATKALEKALGILRNLSDRGGMAQALNEAGALHRVRSDIEQAEACHQQALDLARQIGSSWDEASALAGLGRCALAAGHTASAIAHLQRAQEIFRRIGAAEASELAAELSAVTDDGPPA